MEKIMEILKNMTRTIRDMNERYKTPEIKMTPTVRWSLLLLRIYLLAMVVVIFIKFTTTLIHP
jgi:hypothetical protein